MNEQQINELKHKLEQIPDDQWKTLSWSEEDQQDIVQKLREARLTTLLSVFSIYFKASDNMGFTIVIASSVAHCIPGEMLWVRIYGGSRSGKTELLRAIAEHEDSAKMEVITPASIRGGLDEGHRLLERIKDKLVITKDLASMLTTKRELRNEVFGLMRNVKDGELVSDFGTEEGYLRQQAEFDWLIGTTPVFAQYRQMEDLLGSRFIDLNWQATDREEMTFRALENDETLNTVIRPKIAEAVCKLIDRAKAKRQVYPAELGDDTKRVIVDWADLTALLRSPVARDWQHRIKFHPEPEVGTSLAQNLARIAKALMLLDISDVTPYLARLCKDSIPYSRREALKALLRGESFERQYDLEDMRELGICEKSDNKYFLKPELKERITRLVSQWT